MGSSICKLWALLLLQAPLSQANLSVSGQIMRPGNKRMDPVPGVWVVLHRVGPDRSGPLDSVRADSRGRYTFRYVRSGSEEAIYFVSASYDGIAYFTPPLSTPTVRGEEGQITVFDTTSRPVPLSLRGHHVVVSAVDANALRSVVEVYQLSNDSSVTRVSPDDKPSAATWQTHILPAATNFKVGQGDIPPQAVSFADGVVSVFAPIAPGLKQVSFSYTLPAKAFPLKVPLEKATAIYEIMIEEQAGSVTGPNIKEVEPVSVESRKYRRFLGTNMPENALAIIDLPAPPPRAIDPRYLVALTLVLGGSMILALAQALRKK